MNELQRLYEQRPELKAIVERTNTILNDNAQGSPGDLMIAYVAIAVLGEMKRDEVTE